MLGILWLTLWAAVGDALYNNYWNSSRDEFSSGFKMDWQSYIHENFSDTLRTFAKAYRRDKREGEEELTISIAKQRLRMLKVFEYNGEATDFDETMGSLLPLAEGIQYCMMGRHTKVDCNHCTCVAGQLYMCTGMICPENNAKPPPFSICTEGNQRKIDSCNYCYCRNGREFCTTKNCWHNHQSLRSGRCKEGSRRHVDCNRCLCLQGEWYCTQKDCNQDKRNEGVVNPLPWPPLCMNGQTLKLECKRCQCIRNRWICQRIPCGKRLIKHSYLESCIDGRERKLDSCNYCYCRNGREFCEMKTCRTEKRQLSNLRSTKCVNGVHHIVDDCNYCYCYNGQYFCTQRLCPNIEAEKYPCKKGMTQKLDECNYCVCQDGEYVCTENSCEISVEEPFIDLTLRRSCRIGQWRYVGCKRCICAGHRWVCSKKNCKKYRNTVVPQKLLNLRNTKCVEGTHHVLDDCNFCFCYNGEYFCTYRLCPNLEAETYPCIEGITHNIDKCNYCVCRDGEYVCTENTCEITDEESFTDLTLRRSCTRGKIRFVGCKKCICTGKRWACTKDCKNQYDIDVPENLRLGQRKTCERWDVKYENCRHCECHDNRWVCREIDCDDPDKEPHQDVCKKGDKRKLDSCNKCFCRYGQWFCEDKECGDVDEVWVNTNNEHPNFVGLEHLSSSRRQCVMGEKRKLACNSCYCRNGRWFCESKDCTKIDSRWNLKTDDQASFEDPHKFELVLGKNCFVGELKQTECYQCGCFFSGWVCRMKTNCQTNHTKQPETAESNSSPFTRRKDPGLYINDASCKEGSQRQIDACNYCICLKGREYCTQISCPNSTPDRACTPGEKVPNPDQCNECLCLKGEIVCTTYVCVYRASDALRSGDQYEQGKCSIGRRGRVDACNYCYCNYDNKWICSHHSCTSRSGQSSPDSMPFCVDGAKRIINNCNVCYCNGGQEYCTQKLCSSAPQPMYFNKPQCQEGQALPDPDGCNKCTCINSEILCTNQTCVRRTSVKHNPKSDCVEGEKYSLNDGCNYCVCQGGQEFCTSRACLRPEKYPTIKGSKCEEGEVSQAEDSCNVCVCIEGKLTCTTKECPPMERQGKETPSLRSRPGIKTKGSRFRKMKMLIGTCVSGKFYVPEYEDPNCPNDCICDTDEILCTNRKCDKRDRANALGNWYTKSLHFRQNAMKLLKPDACEENQQLPSDDPCNSCICLNERKVCTITTCSDKEDPIDISEEFKGQGNKGKKGRNASIKVKRNGPFCTPFTFFSPDNNRFCRNCFCLHNGLALCLLNLCKYSKDIPHNPPIQQLQDSCTPGETGYPTKCVTCTCSKEAKWICTREELALCNERDCDAKDEFQMGFYPFCAGCKCSTKEWYCAIQPNKCQDYSDAKCPIGTLIHNPRQYCSVCLCGGYEEGSYNMCFTESKCVRQVSSHLKT